MTETDHERDRRLSGELASALAAVMPGWRRVEHGDPDSHRWYTLVRADGTTVSVTVGGYRLAGRVTLRGVWPRYKDGNRYQTATGELAPEITCSASRAPKAIARELERRLLPEFLAKSAAAVAYVAQHDAFQVDAEAAAERIAAAIGGTVEAPGGRPGGSRDAIPIRGEPEAVHRLQVEPAYGSTTGNAIYSSPMGVSFEVHHLDPETAATVLALIADAQAARDEAPRARVATGPQLRIGPSEAEPEAEEETSHALRGSDSKVIAKTG